MLVVLVRCILIVARDNVDYERQERVDEDVAALVIVAPLLKQVQQVLAKQATLAVLRLERLQKLRSDFRRHLGNHLLVDLREGHESFYG